MTARDRRLHSAAAERNGEPILAALRDLLPPTGTALEIASGTGQHAARFAGGLPGWRWQPSDADASMFDSIAAWTEGLGNVLAPIVLDAAADTWPVEGPYDAIFCANLIHIAPWAACEGLMRGAARVLAPHGVLITYGPYFVAAETPAPSNVAFDADLKARNPAWGVRALDEVSRAASRCGLALERRVAMPANNFVLLFRRDA